MERWTDRQTNRQTNRRSETIFPARKAGDNEIFQLHFSKGVTKCLAQLHIKFQVNITFRCGDKDILCFGSMAEAFDCSFTKI